MQWQQKDYSTFKDPGLTQWVTYQHGKKGRQCDSIPPRKIGGRRSLALEFYEANAVPWAEVRGRWWWWWWWCVVCSCVWWVSFWFQLRHTHLPLSACSIHHIPRQMSGQIISHHTPPIKRGDMHLSLSSYVDHCQKRRHCYSLFIKGRPMNWRQLLPEWKSSQ